MSEFWSRDPARKADRVSSAETVATMQGVAELKAEVRQLRAVLFHVLSSSVQGQPVVLHEDPIRSFLNLPLNATPEEARDRLVRSQARVVGRLSCPKCGALVQDREGIADEKCQFCGELVQTGR